MNDDDVEETQSVVLASCEDHGLVVGNPDGTLSRLVPAREGAPLPPQTTSVASVKRGDEAGTVKVTRHKLRAGPSRTSNPRYRSGWDAVFAKRDRTLN